MEIKIGEKEQMNNQISKYYKKLNLVIIPLFLILLIGCTAQSIFVNMDLKEGDLSFDKPYKLNISAEYTLDGDPMPKYDDEVLTIMEDVLSDVGFAKATSSRNAEGTMHIVIDLKSNFLKSVAKIAITEYTWGLIGYTLDDEYSMDVELTLNDGETITKTGYKQTVVWTAGLGQDKNVVGMREVAIPKALEKAAEQLILQFLNDIN